MVTYPTFLEKSIFSMLVALSGTEVGKVVLPNSVEFIDVATGKPVTWLKPKPSLEDEIRMLQSANRINDLMPKFIRQQMWQSVDDGKAYPMLVMERLYPLPIHHFDLDIRQEMFLKFELQMKALHDNLFVHGDFMRPTNYRTRNNFEWMFKNIIQTQQGLRLIDTGFSLNYSPKDGKKFVHLLHREIEEMLVFKEYYLDNLQH
ncbi:MAG: hypothetical protein RLZZ628_255 [Bacteroidota bacterium]|jgi:hypothetical protein